jgi:hypothetical protein
VITAVGPVFVDVPAARRIKRDLRGGFLYLERLCGYIAQMTPPGSADADYAHSGVIDSERGPVWSIRVQLATITGSILARVVASMVTVATVENSFALIAFSSAAASITD